jgi:hypothetical protein
MLLVLLCMRDTKSDGSAAVGVSAVAQRCTSRIPLELAGAPEEIRTPDPQIRSLVLYPAELRARFSLGMLGF